MLAMGAAAIAAWGAVVRSGFALSMLAGKPKLQLAHLVITMAMTAASAAAATLYTGFSPNWPHWDGPMVSTHGLKEFFSVWAGAFTEEAWARYLMLGTALAVSRSTLVALLASAAIFTLGHPGANYFYIAALGIWLGAIALSTGSIWPAVAAHFATNVVVRVLFSSGPLAHPTLLDYTLRKPFEAVLSALALLGSAYLLWPLLKQDPVLRFLRGAPGRLGPIRTRIAASAG